MRHSELCERLCAAVPEISSSFMEGWIWGTLVPGSNQKQSLFWFSPFCVIDICPRRGDRDRECTRVGAAGDHERSVTSASETSTGERDSFLAEIFTDISQIQLRGQRC